MIGGIITMVGLLIAIIGVALGGIANIEVGATATIGMIIFFVGMFICVIQMFILAGNASKNH